MADIIKCEICDNDINIEELYGGSCTKCESSYVYDEEGYNLDLSKDQLEILRREVKNKLKIGE
jgi:hypothetical protein